MQMIDWGQGQFLRDILHILGLQVRYSQVAVFWYIVYVHDYTWYTTHDAYIITTEKTEYLAHKLRSIIAQLEFRFIIDEWEKKGAPFRTYLYVPEIHPITNAVFSEREDEVHVLKVIWCMYMSFC